MLLINAEDDRFLVGVTTLLKEVCYLLCDEICALIKNQRSVVVLCVIFPIVDLVTFAVYLSSFRSIALDVTIDMTLTTL